MGYGHGFSFRYCTGLGWDGAEWEGFNELERPRLSFCMIIICPLFFITFTLLKAMDMSCWLGELVR